MTVPQIIEHLHSVKDPEIPTISVVDMGIVSKVEMQSLDRVVVTITPTFVGCPALEVMKRNIEHAVMGIGIKYVDVIVSYDIPWSSNRITEQGRAALLKHGLAPPVRYDDTVELQLDVLNETPCPFCGSMKTILKSPFGPALCRSLHYCNNCLQAFESFKPV
ncbi:MAG: phenylacetate-CoA oxygenase subunit PaaJ [Ignavibacteria bacterium]|nr:phenylacetate-CoA oxygenase subunit PaaJ [Ignavibacteria bacterium]